MNWSKVLSIGSAALKDEESINRVKTVNKICLIVAGAVLVIGTVMYIYLHGQRNVIVPLAIEFVLNACVLWLNHTRKHTSASICLYLVQCFFITYFGIQLVQLFHLEYVIILLYAVIFLIFTERVLRILAFVAATTVFVLLEIAYYKNGYAHLTFISYDATFLINILVVCSIIIITSVVCVPYVKSNDLKYEVQRVNKLIKLFAAQLTHELRAALDNIHYVAQLLRGAVRKDAGLRKIEPLVDAAWSVSSNAIAIVNNVLDMTDIEAGKSSAIVNEAFRVQGYFDKILEVHKIIARRERIGLELNIDPDMPEVIISDPLTINQILTNLLTNAFKYGARQSLVRVAIKKREFQWQLTVSNFGPGIPPEKIGSIFELFYTGKTGHIQGSGLGLYIVKTKVHAMGGQITVDSKQNGLTTFAVTLPLREGKLRDLPDLTGSDPETADFHRAHILVAEDNKLTVFLLSQFLRDMGCSFTIVGDGLQLLDAIKKCPDQSPDIILLDCHMPNMNGEETIRQLKENPFLAHIPIIVTTGDIFTNNIEKMLEAGASTYLKKPIDHLALRKAISLYLKKLPQN
ncbi:MAG TPA: hybrid sensor histidine kinase/response regulator [Puia sp.]|nr:hybrid sensor histidine kinase/response regulator [Puia sp.]